jgi:DivIVA domain-containing protein
MLLLWVLLGIAVLGAVAVVAAGAGEGAVKQGPDRAAPVLPHDRPVTGGDVEAVRFSVELRGYRMQEVDDVLDRVARDLAWRDERIAELESQVRPAPTGAAGPPGLPVLDPSDAPVQRALVVPMDGEQGPDHG